MADLKVLDRNTIERAWAWHLWSPRWLPGRAVTLFKRFALTTFGQPGICRLDTGRNMVVTLSDAIQCTIAHAGEWEGAIHQAVRRFVKPGEVVLDVGGHVGYSTLQFADWVGRDGRVYVFEPIPANADRIDANLVLNGLRERVWIQRAAVSDSFAEVEFAESSTLNTGMGAISSGKGTRRVTTVALDEWLHVRGLFVSLLKLDIEGAEILALKGLERTLAKQWIRAIMMEIHPQELPKFGSSVDEVLGRLSNAGYRLAFWDNMGEFVERPTPADSGYVLATRQ